MNKDDVLRVLDETEPTNVLQNRIAKLRAPWQAVDSMDWDYIMSALGNGKRDRFWKDVLTEMRTALRETP